MRVTAAVCSLVLAAGASCLTLVGSAAPQSDPRPLPSTPAPSAARTPPAAPRRFRLAVVRRDGVLLPFASYDAGRWENSWPPPALNGEVPISLRDIPKKWWGKQPVPAEWTFWPVGGGAPRPLRPLAPAWVPSPCHMSFGVRTDHANGERVPQHVLPYPKDGLATAGDAPVEPVAILTSASADWIFAMNVLTDAVAAEEDGWLKDASGTLGNRALRQRTPVVLEALYRSPGMQPGSALFYFEASKHYPGVPREGTRPCDVVLFAAGWITRDPAAVARSGMSLALTYCDMPGVEFMLPLGALRLEGTLLWVVQWAGWGRERYAVINAEPDRIGEVFSAPGGRCEEE